MVGKLILKHLKKYCMSNAKNYVILEITSIDVSLVKLNLLHFLLMAAILGII